ncbi:protein-ADP-ribose hydrolase, partial [Streptococcus parasuis]
YARTFLRKSNEYAISTLYHKCTIFVSFYYISTGEFRFPNQLAAEIAVKTVRSFIKKHPNIRVVFNVFKDLDREIYQELLQR